MIERGVQPVAMLIRATPETTWTSVAVQCPARPQTILVCFHMDASTIPRELH